MTAPEPPEDARQVRLYLEGAIRELWDKVGPIDAAIERLAADIALLVADEKKKPVVIHWPDLEESNPGLAAEKRAELVTWTREVLSRYNLAYHYLRDGWQENPAALDAVTAAWGLWVSIYRARGTWDAANCWQREVMPTLADQLKNAKIGKAAA